MNLLVWFKDLFVPHSRNNHKAKVLHPAYLSIIVAIFLMTQFGLEFFTLQSPAVLGFASDIVAEKVVELTNQKRSENGLQLLQINQTLNQVATKKAGDMFAFDYWAHTSPSGRDPWSFFLETGYQYLYAGENLARDFMTSEATVEAWMNSSSHRDNLLNPHYQEIGLAVVDGTLNGIETTLVVQVFGTPQPTLAGKTALPQSATEPSKENSLTKLSLVESAFAQATEEAGVQPSVSPFSLTKIMALLLLSLIFVALVVDALWVQRKRVVRLSGKNLAHLIFVGSLLLAIILTEAGMIL